MTRKTFNILCMATCLLYPFNSYGGGFGNIFGDIEHDLDHISVPVVRQPNPAARPVQAPNAGTLAVGTGMSVQAGGQLGGGASASGVPVLPAQQAPVIRPGQLAVSVPGASLTDGQTSAVRSYGREASRPGNRVSPQQGEARKSLQREPSRESAPIHHVAAPKPGPRPAMGSMAGHATAQHHAVATQPHPTHTVQRSVAKLNQVGHSSQHHASSPHR